MFCGRLVQHSVADMGQLRWSQVRNFKLDWFEHVNTVHDSSPVKSKLAQRTLEGASGEREGGIHAQSRASLLGKR